MLPAAFVFTQEMSITIAARNESITVSPDDENEDKILSLRTSIPAAKEDYLTVKVANDEIEKDWTRNFIIYDEEDNEISKLAERKENTYCVALEKLLPLLKPRKEYALYTSALPKDPQKAMEVKISRQLVCKINQLQ